MFTEANRLRTFYNDRDEVVDSLANRFVDEYHVVCDRPSHDGAGSTKTELVPLQDRTQLLEDSADAAESKYQGTLCAADPAELTLETDPLANPERSAAGMMTPDTDQSIRKALAFQASNQHENGSWGHGALRNNAAVCSLAGMTFISSESTPGYTERRWIDSNS